MDIPRQLGHVQGGEGAAPRDRRRSHRQSLTTSLVVRRARVHATYSLRCSSMLDSSPRASIVRSSSSSRIPTCGHSMPLA